MRILIIVLILGCAFLAEAQTKDFFSADSLRKDLAILASDSFQGRKTLSPGIQKASEYISDQFRRLHLKGVNKREDYYSPFLIGNPVRQQLIVNNEKISPNQYYAFSKEDIPPLLTEKEMKVQRPKAENALELYQFVMQTVTSGTPALIQLSDKQSTFMEIIEDSAAIIRSSLQSYLIIYPSDDDIKTFSVQVSPEAKANLANNIIGVLPGKSLPAEYVIISAHYDHVGFKRSRRTGEDTIYNGANDDASGVAAMLAFAKYFAQKNDNARTLIFVAFAGEEMGLLGSDHLSKRMQLEKIKALLNLEMLGKPDDAVKPTLNITGAEYSTLYKAFRKYMKNLSFQPDSYPDQRLHTRSDHYPFFIKGVVAHTFMYFQPQDPDYHQVTDDITTIDFSNFSNTLRALLPGFEAIISGKETPKLLKN